MMKLNLDFFLHSPKFEQMEPGTFCSILSVTPAKPRKVLGGGQEPSSRSPAISREVADR